MTADFEFYGFNTSNGFNIRVIFELLNGITSYNYHDVNLTKNENNTIEFLKLNPNGKIPVIIDNTIQPPLILSESGAILQYLSEKYPSSNLIPDSITRIQDRIEVFKWLYWQVSCHGPEIGSFVHFKHFAKEKIPYAIEKYEKGAHRIFKLLDDHLSNRLYIAANQLTIADISLYGWSIYLRFGLMGTDYTTKYSNVLKWLDNLDKLPAFKSTFAIAADSMAKRQAAQVDAAATAATTKLN